MGAAHRTPAPKEPSLQKEGEPAPPLEVHLSSSPDKVITAPSQTGSPPDNFREHQALLKRVPTDSNLKIEAVTEESNNLTLYPPASRPMAALPIHPGVLKIVKLLWQTPSSILPTSKKVEKKYPVPAKEFECLYTHPPAASLVVSAVNERDRQGQVSGMPKSKEAKRLDLFGRKM
ncbi:hypothetical protein UY3_01128 [Chelonia mydas]|uniref:Uncharacterized protein n=1 Tax=Chelonia mydas TaxID=8469 RepID=M7CAC4_CHEMY|nr:hypothetical protein UY3_01128 [Chelonia mydas]